MPPHAAIRRKIDALETEMRRLGLWQSAPPTEAQFAFREAFARDTLAFEQWLQFVFIPRVRAILAGAGEWPASSDVGVAAVRNFDGYPEAGRLVTLLCEFDELFDGAAPPHSGR